MRTSSQAGALGMLAAALSSGAAIADPGVTFNNTNRVAQAIAGIGPSLPGITTSTASTGPWMVSQFQSPVFGEPPGASTYTGGAGLGFQDSTLGPDRLLGTLTSTAWDGNQGWGGAAGSTLTASFTVPAALDYHLTGSWSVSSRFSWPGETDVASGQLTLSGPGGFLIQRGTFGANPTYSGMFDLSGTLMPGSYTLSVTTDAHFTYVGSNYGARAGSVTFDLLVPEPGAIVLAVVPLVLLARRRRA